MRENRIEAIAKAVERAIDTEPLNDVVGVVAGCFVGLMEGLVRQRGEDPSRQITLTGDNGREITLHAKAPKEKA